MATRPPDRATVAQQDILAVADVLDTADGEVLTLGEIADRVPIPPGEVETVLGLLERQASVSVERRVSLDGEPAWVVEG